MTRVGGAGRDRTGDPLVANQVLSQLSYSPGLRWGPLDAALIRWGGRWMQPPSDGGPPLWRRSVAREVVGLSGFEPLTSRLSAVRSSQLSYRPVDAARQPSAFWILLVAKEQNGRPEAAVGKGLPEN